VFTARLICSDPGCDAEDEVEAATVAELESLACDCGCALEIVGWPLVVEPEDVAVVLSLRRRGVLRDAA
jgi:hypothetical protein